MDEILRLDDVIRKLRFPDENVVDAIAEQVHNAWMRFYSKTPKKDLMVPYSALSSEDKEIDKNIVRVVVAELGGTR
jgi:hypothetical protein